MYIKRITIQGFKTYKNTTVVDELSPNHNVVVGRNGSGKSNFFAAIRFVLSDAYTHMTREERQGLIHEGSGSVLLAYVEIIFDNVDRRFPLAKDEVSVRRTIGLKKDDYSLDGKSASRSDIMNLLELAGFSKSNPYYIVPQGKITNLTNSKDTERLSLLKEVSGARIFETKLKESTKEMEGANFKNQRIDEALHSIEERLLDLQIESNDLKEYQTLEKSKKIYEFNIFDRELDEINSQVETLDQEYTDVLAQLRKDLDDLDDKDKLLQTIKFDSLELKRTLDLAQIEKDQVEIDYNYCFDRLSKKKVELEQNGLFVADVKLLESNLNSNIDHYTKLIADTRDILLKKTPKLQKFKLEEAVLTGELEALISRQRTLYLRQNRFLKFKTKEERNQWLEQEIEKYSGDFIVKNEALSKIRGNQATKEKKLTDIESEISTLNDSLNSTELDGEIIRTSEKISSLKREITSLTDKRKQLWRDEILLNSARDSTTNSLNIARQTVRETMDKSIAHGFLAVSKIAKLLGIEKSIYGPVGDLFTVNEKYKTAAEVVAGNSLFHIVVKDDTTASLILEELIRTKAGRVSFIPLNRIRAREYNYPDSSVEECMPLMKKIKADDQKVLPALQHIFGSYVLTVDLEKGGEIARNYSVNCITLDGDKVDDKGTLSGGFHDYRKSKIDALKLQKKMIHELQENEVASKNLTLEIETIGPKLNELNNSLQATVKKHQKLVSSKEPIKAKLAAVTETKFTVLGELEAINWEHANLSSVLETLNKKISDLKGELTSDLSLNDQEKGELRKLQSEISLTEEKLHKNSVELGELESESMKLECELHDNYEPYLIKLREELNTLLINSGENTDSGIVDEVRLLEAEVDGHKALLQELKKKTNGIQANVDKNNELLKKSKKQRSQLVKKLSKFSESSEKSLNKKAILNNRHDEILKRIRDLGVLPEEAYKQEKFQELSSEDLLKLLNSVNEELVKYSHINKKAIEQYNIFTKQRDDLVARRKELETSKDSIEELIYSLQEQKDEAIKKSFSQISVNFEKIFSKLVPNGVGKLILLKKGSDPATQSDSLDDYDGVAISVSFNSTEDEQQRIEQLSGGQKSLCAIALILAIQSCDPAPFYLFDEIDANLDTQYRGAVAKVISSLARNAQFICTTFRPEMLQVADKFYGVAYNNKVSVVSEIDREEALSFVGENEK